MCAYIYIHIPVHTTLRHPHSSIVVSRCTLPRGLFLFILRRLRHFPYPSSLPSLPLSFHVSSAGSRFSARGSTTVFRGVNKVDAGANSVYFALFFQKKRVRA